MTDNKANTVAPRQRSATYPRFSLRESENLARIVFDKGVRQCDQDRIAQAAGYKSAFNGSFVAHRASANQFGLVEVSGQYLSVSAEWINVLHEDDPELLRAARLAAFQRPTLYRKIIDAYKDRQFPPLDKLTRDLYLNKKYGILQEAARTAAETFIESANYADVFDVNGYLRIDNIEESSEQNDPYEGDTATPPYTADTTLLPSVDRRFGSTAQIAAAGLRNRALVARGPSETQEAPSMSATPAATPEVKSAPSGLSITLPEGLHRFDVPLKGGKTAYLFVPGSLLPSDKERLKGYIDLVLDEEVPQPALRRESEQNSTADQEVEI